MADLVTQASAQALIASRSSAIASGANASALIGSPSKALCSDLVIAVLFDPTPPVPAWADLTQLEALIEGDATFYSCQAFAEVLLEDDGNFCSSHSWLEVLYGYEQVSPNIPTYEPMSDYLFPTLPGLDWDIQKTPAFSTQISSHVSGREVRVSNYAYPIWTWEMSYEFLRAGAEEELQTLMGFFLARSGTFDTFLYADPDEDNVLTKVTLGIGDSSQTVWHLSKTFAGFTEPCGYVDPSSIRVYFGDVEQLSGWTFFSPNGIVFASAPPIDTVVKADYTWYYRVRFGDDSQTYSQFMFELWELQKVTLKSVKP